MRDLRGGFQFTHPCGCDGQAVRNIPIPVRFNSRTRVGATARKAFNVPDAEVSIHAPVWVRPSSSSHSPGRVKFQFTHPCGCDIPTVLVRIPCSCFNSRTRVGATVRLFPQTGQGKVSIHAPVWVRRLIAHGKLSYTVFQFTHPCGCDPNQPARGQRPRGFNSRTRVGATA